MELEQGANTPIQTSINSTIDYFVNAKKNSQLKAPLIEKYALNDTSFTEMPKGFEAFFYDSLETVESHLQADEGTYLENAHKVIARNNVVVENKKGEKLYTEELIWLQDSSIIWTDKFVKIVQPDGVIYGEGLSAAEDFSSYEINKITGEINYEEAKSR